MASPTLSGDNPPARNTGWEIRHTNSSLTDQSWIRLVPPYSGVLNEGRLESSKIELMASLLINTLIITTYVVIKRKSVSLNDKSEVMER